MSPEAKSNRLRLLSPGSGGQPKCSQIFNSAVQANLDLTRGQACERCVLRKTPRGGKRRVDDRTTDSRLLHLSFSFRLFFRLRLWSDDFVRSLSFLFLSFRAATTACRGHAHHPRSTHRHRKTTHPFRELSHGSTLHICKTNTLSNSIRSGTDRVVEGNLLGVGGRDQQQRHHRRSAGHQRLISPRPLCHPLTQIGRTRLDWLDG